MPLETAGSNQTSMVRSPMADQHGQHAASNGIGKQVLRRPISGFSPPPPD